MKTEFLSEALVMKSLVEDSLINVTRRERRRVIDASEATFREINDIKKYE
jgi:hypothetical protein